MGDVPVGAGHQAGDRLPHGHRPVFRRACHRRTYRGRTVWRGPRGRGRRAGGCLTYVRRTDGRLPARPRHRGQIHAQFGGEAPGEGSGPHPRCLGAGTGGGRMLDIGPCDASSWSGAVQCLQVDAAVFREVPDQGTRLDVAARAHGGRYWNRGGFGWWGGAFGGRAPFLCVTDRSPLLGRLGFLGFPRARGLPGLRGLLEFLRLPGFLPLRPDEREGGPHRHRRTGLDEQLRHGPGFEALNLDGRLRGFDDRDRIALVHGVTGPYQPFQERALIHVRAEGRHGELGHDQSTARCVAATMSAVCGRAASSSCRAYGMGTSALHTRSTGASRS